MDDMIKAIRQRRGMLSDKKVESKRPSKSQEMIESLSSMSPDEKSQLLKLLGVSEQSQENRERDKAPKTEMYSRDEKEKKEKEMLNTRMKELQDEIAFEEEQESEVEDDVMDEEKRRKIAEGMLDRRFVNNSDIKPRNLHERAQMHIARLIKPNK